MDTGGEHSFRKKKKQPQWSTYLVVEFATCPWVKGSGCFLFFFFLASQSRVWSEFMSRMWDQKEECESKLWLRVYPNTMRFGLEFPRHKLPLFLLKSLEETSDMACKSQWRRQTSVTSAVSLKFRLIHTLVPRNDIRFFFIIPKMFLKELWTYVELSGTKCRVNQHVNGSSSYEVQQYNSSHAWSWLTTGQASVGMHSRTHGHICVPQFHPFHWSLPSSPAGRCHL